MIGIFSAAFLLSYFSFLSKSEEDVLLLRKALANTEEQPSFETSQIIHADEEGEIARLHSRHSLDPFGAYATLTLALGKSNSVDYDIYFRPDVLYTHLAGSNSWKKVDYTHPTAGELQSVKEPIAFWSRLVKHVKHIKRTEQGEKIRYVAELKPFRDDVHGVTIDDVESAAMELWVSKNPYIVEKAELSIKFKDKISNIHTSIKYEMKVLNAGHTIQIQPPAWLNESTEQILNNPSTHPTGFKSTQKKKALS
jgi:hypothetical protein